ncbi:hypothetical protein FHT75_002543 [Rhizobium sp. BK112]|jgi:hypothetical protein|nr:hypothetical protein [Rhizobium sp. BK112]
MLHRRQWEAGQPTGDRYPPDDDLDKLRHSHFQDFCYRSLVMGVGVMVAASLVPDAFYWAKSSKHFDGRITIVQVSTVFGEDPAYWTLALVGTDQHAMPADFEIIASAELADGYPLRHAAE